MQGHFKGGARKKDAKGGKRTINTPKSKNKGKKPKNRKGIV